MFRRIPTRAFGNSPVDQFSETGQRLDIRRPLHGRELGQHAESPEFAVLGHELG